MLNHALPADVPNCKDHNVWFGIPLEVDNLLKELRK